MIFDVKMKVPRLLVVPRKEWQSFSSNSYILIIKLDFTFNFIR